VADQALDNLALKEINLKKLLTPEVKRLAASHVRESLGLSLRKACLLVNLSTFVYRYQPKQGNDDAVRRRLRELAEERKRFGSPRLHIMLKREGLVVNHKRTERLYREKGLASERKEREKEPPEPEWYYLYRSGQTKDGQWTSSLTVSSPGGASVP
jgi:hypothetical protein